MASNLLTMMFIYTKCQNRTTSIITCVHIKLQYYSINYYVSVQEMDFDQEVELWSSRLSFVLQFSLDFRLQCQFQMFNQVIAGSLVSTFSWLHNVELKNWKLKKVINKRHRVRVSTKCQLLKPMEVSFPLGWLPWTSDWKLSRMQCVIG